MSHTPAPAANRPPVSLETAAEAEATKKATVIIENPGLNPGNGFLKEMNRYTDEQFDGGTWTGKSRKSKPSIRKMFGQASGPVYYHAPWRVLGEY